MECFEIGIAAGWLCAGFPEVHEHLRPEHRAVPAQREGIRGPVLASDEQ